jgi:tetratricopeptide (TPR) repeat protein
MSKKQNDRMADLQRLPASQNFQSEEDIHQFLQGLRSRPIPSVPKVAKSPKAQALYLVELAMDQKTEERSRDFIDEPLDLDPDCIEAYINLGNTEERGNIAAVFLEKGMQIGRRLYGGEFLEKHKGNNWHIHETRPFMNCMHLYAVWLYYIKRPKEALAIQEELIELQPADPLGVRDTLLLYLAALDPAEKFQKYDKLFREDTCTFLQLNLALFAFRQTGDSPEAILLLQSALIQNKNLAKLLLAEKPVFLNVNAFILEDVSEAEFIAEKAQPVWIAVHEVLDWLKKHSAKAK